MQLTPNLLFFRKKYCNIDFRDRETKNFYRKRQNMKNAIEVINLQKKYGDMTAVNNISFSVKQGELFAFLGENGAGK